jgi:uncharacterized protein YjiS (DUF1127 family)
MSSNRKPFIDWPDSQHPAATEGQHSNSPDLLSLALRSSRGTHSPPGDTSADDACSPNETCSPSISPTAPLEAATARNPTFWASFFDSLTDGFVLYGASIYPSGFFPLDLTTLGATPPCSDEILAQVSHVRAAADAPPISPRAAPEHDGDAPSPPNWLRWIVAAVAMPWAWYRRERDIRNAAERLVRLDDHILRDIGIADRCQIEGLVRRHQDRSCGDF